MTLFVAVQWDKIEDKSSVAVYGVGAVTVLWLSSSLVTAINGLPVVRLPTCTCCTLQRTLPLQLPAACLQCAGTCQLCSCARGSTCHDNMLVALHLTLPGAAHSFVYECVSLYANSSQHATASALLWLCSCRSSWSWWALRIPRGSCTVTSSSRCARPAAAAGDVPSYL